MCQDDFAVRLTPHHSCELLKATDYCPAGASRPLSLIWAAAEDWLCLTIWCAWLSGNILCSVSLHLSNIICLVERKWKMKCISPAEGLGPVFWAKNINILIWNVPCYYQKLNSHGVVQQLLRSCSFSLVSLECSRRCVSLIECLCSLDSPLTRSVFIAITSSNQGKRHIENNGQNQYVPGRVARLGCSCRKSCAWSSVFLKKPLVLLAKLCIR